jgi:hypothetical protein
MVQCGEGDGTNNQTGIYSLARDASYASSDITISNNYFSGSSSNMLLRQANRWIIENNYFAGNWSSASNHGQQISPGGCDDFVLRGNIFKDSTVFIIGAHAPINRRWQIYNNIVIGGTLSAGWSNAAASEKDNVVQWQIHNNTYFNVNFGGRGVVFPGLLTDIFASRSYAYNNLFYNCIHPRMDNPDATVGAIIHDNNAYLSCTGIYSSAAESAPLIGSADPFVDSAGGNYQLRTGSLPINKGKALIAAYSKDYNGVTRPQGGAWDIGAYEYLTAQSTLFVTSVNGTVTSNPSGINCGATCYANFNAVEWVTLNAVPNNGYIFAGWSGGGCSGTGACKVYMASAQTVTANYAAVSTVPTIPTAKYYLAVNKTVNAGGTIISSDKTINCGSTCKSYYNSGKTVTLYLSTNSGYRFTRWTGACQGQGTTCNVKMDTSKNTKAYFEVLGGTLFYPEGAMK